MITVEDFFGIEVTFYRGLVSISVCGYLNLLDDFDFKVIRNLNSSKM